MKRKMTDIVVFGGTTEGRILAEALQHIKVQVHICVATEYGAALIPQCPNIHVHSGRMQEEQIERFLLEWAPEYCLDATHPYAADITRNVQQACRNTNTSFVRILRKEVAGIVPERNVKTRKDGSGTEREQEIFCQDEHGVLYFDRVEETVEYLRHTTGNVLLTTGSRDLEKYTLIEGYQERCFARVLPTLPVMEKCKALGFEGRNLIGMQGPFSEELNFWMLKQIQADYLVTKSSGREGGFAEKCEAALRAGVTVLVIGRPQEPDICDGEKLLYLPEAVAWLKERYGEAGKKRLYLVGMGPGAENQLTREAVDVIKHCDVIFGAKRLLAICERLSDKPSYPCYRRDEIVTVLQEHPEYHKAALVYSGDIGFYSGARGLVELAGEYELLPVSGISSVVYFLNRLLVPWEDTELVSCHGKRCNLFSVIQRKKRVCALLGGGEDFYKLCKELVEFNRLDIRITVGEWLSYPEERIVTGTAEYFLREELAPLSVVLFENPQPEKQKKMAEIADGEFIRGRVPMTKQEVRSLSLGKLALTRDAVVYDIGAGTGSVAVEASLRCSEGNVYAIEKKAEGIQLIKANKRHFEAVNLTVVKGTAPECLEGLPAPTHVFIGGSSGRLLDIIRCVREKNRQARFVINAVTLETIAKLSEIKREFPEYRNPEVVQVNIAKGRELGGYQFMAAQNPVYIISFGGEECR